MDLARLLRDSKTEVVADALQGLARATLPHYTASGGEENRDRLARLYDLTAECVEARRLIPIVEYARGVARQRHRDGFDLHEVHTAFNVLEEVIWRRIVARMEPLQYPEAFGLVSTVLGAGKEALALEYVALAGSSRGGAGLDLSALFKGTT